MSRTEAFETQIRATIAACEAAGHRYDPTVADAPVTETADTDAPTRGFTTNAQRQAVTREMQHAVRLVQNTYHRRNAREFEREHYAALGFGTW